jgi:hypothetical protein
MTNSLDDSPIPRPSPSPFTGPTVTLPAFSAPEPDPALPPVPGPDQTTLVEDGGRRGRGIRRRDRDRALTASTATDVPARPEPSSADLKVTGEMVAALVGLAMLGIGLAVRARARRQLRQPTKAQLAAFGTPLGRIAARHVDTAWLNADLKDLVEAASAAGAYLTDEDLTSPLQPDPGVPAGLNSPEVTP